MEVPSTEMRFESSVGHVGDLRTFRSTKSAVVLMFTTVLRKTFRVASESPIRAVAKVPFPHTTTSFTSFVKTSSTGRQRRKKEKRFDHRVSLLSSRCQTQRCSFFSKTIFGEVSERLPFLSRSKFPLCMPRSAVKYSRQVRLRRAPRLSSSGNKKTHHQCQNVCPLGYSTGVRRNMLLSLTIKHVLEEHWTTFQPACITE